MSEPRARVIVLAGGPDAERDVSLDSGRAIADALRASGRFDVELAIIDALTPDQLRAMPGDVVFPALHGPWGEGGPLQDVLEADGRPYVGCGPRAARLAMDKVALKTIAQREGIPTTPTCVLNPADPVCPLDLPVVAKPTHEGSTIGLFICRDEDDWARAHAEASRAASERGRVYMVEPFIEGREITSGVVDGHVLPLIEIRAADGLYDYEAKYHRDDTRYIVDPDLPGDVGERVRADTLRLARRIGAEAICRADWMVDRDGRAWLLELNTMPGFTSHSLVPMAAAAWREPSASAGLDMSALCARLVDAALRRVAERV